MKSYQNEQRDRCLRDRCPNKVIRNKAIKCILPYRVV